MAAHNSLRKIPPVALAVCLILLIGCVQTNETCESKPAGGERDLCYSQLAVATQNLSLCSKIALESLVPSPHYNGPLVPTQESCVYDITITYNISRCALLLADARYTQSECYLFIAEHLKNSSLCSLIVTNDPDISADSCRYIIAVESSNVSICDAIIAPSWKQNCYEDVNRGK